MNTVSNEEKSGLSEERLQEIERLVAPYGDLLRGAVAELLGECRHLQQDALIDRTAIKTQGQVIEELKQQLRDAQETIRSDAARWAILSEAIQEEDGGVSLDWWPTRGDQPAHFLITPNETALDEGHGATLPEAITDFLVRRAIILARRQGDAGSKIDQAMLLHGAEDREDSLSPAPTASPWPQPDDDNGEYARGVRS